MQENVFSHHVSFVAEKGHWIETSQLLICCESHYRTASECKSIMVVPSQKQAAVEGAHAVLHEVVCGGVQL